jgi:hypothetical protein
MCLRSDTNAQASAWAFVILIGGGAHLLLAHHAGR